MAGKITYTVYLQCDAGLCGNVGDYLSHPLYGESLGIKFDREKDQVFFRKQLSEDIKFKNIPSEGVYDYDCLLALDLEDIVYISIYANCVDPDWGGNDPPIFEGKFTLMDCHINEDDCIISVNPTPNDYYDIIAREWGVEYNIMGLPDFDVRRDFWNLDQFTTCKKLPQVIQYLLDEMFTAAGIPPITYKSTFYDNDFTGLSDNYVTGVDPNPLNELYMLHKSDAMAEAAQAVHPCLLCDWATMGKISLEDLLSDLQAMYDIRFYIYYEAGVAYFRIEHVSFFVNINGIVDLTVLSDNFSKKTYAWHRNKYNYLAVPLREEFRYSEILPIEDGTWTISEAFRDYFYNYETDWGKEDRQTKTHQVKHFNNDLHWICHSSRPTIDMAKPSPTGFILLQCYEFALVRWCNYFNYPLQWTHLTQNYWQDYRSYIYAIRGSIDSEPAFWAVQTFDSKRRLQRQDEIRFAGCCEIWRYDFNIWDLVNTEIGWGEIDSMVYLLSSGIASVVLLHETPDIDKPAITTSSSEPPFTWTGTGTYTDPTTYVPPTTTPTPTTTTQTTETPV